MNRERRTEDISVTSGLFRASLSLFLSSLSAWGHRCLSTTREPATIRLCILAVGRAKEIRPGPEKKKKVTLKTLRVGKHNDSNQQRQPIKPSVS